MHAVVETSKPLFQSDQGGSRPIHAKRLAGALSFVTVVWAVALIVVQNLQGNVFGLGAAVLLGMGLTVFLSASIEWAVHRYVYHRALHPILRPIYRVHHSGHHYVFFPPSRYVANGGVKRFSLDERGLPHVHESEWQNRLTGFTHFAFYMLLSFLTIWTPAAVVTDNRVFIGSMVATSTLISYLFIAVHDAIHHRGLHPMLTGWRWFRFLDDHHYIHHVDTEVNLNFLLPLGDLMFGTLRRSLSADELARHGSAESRRAVAVGFDEPATVARARESLTR
jgi:hypothetical protein